MKIAKQDLSSMFVGTSSINMQNKMLCTVLYYQNLEFGIFLDCSITQYIIGNIISYYEDSVNIKHVVTILSSVKPPKNKIILSLI